MKFLVDKLPDCCLNCECRYLDGFDFKCRIIGFSLKEKDMDKKRHKDFPLSSFNAHFIGDGFVVSH